MSLIKYNPRRYRTQGVNRFFDDLFNDNFFNGNLNSENSFTPKVDIAETEKQFEIQFAIPGIDKNDLSIDLNDGVLTVSGERKVQNEKDERNFHSIETSYGSFKRSFQLPDNIDADKVDAKYEAGILNVTIAKDEKKIQKKTIAVK
ncbi:MAG: Hsp20/alpha crystallin family protein [Reichenbachiella sp.]